ncbi:MAG TPA: hypothetical protein VF339_05800 [Gammaproteobacteria bacterium]
MSTRTAITAALLAGAGLACPAALWAQGHSAASDPDARSGPRPSFTGVWSPQAWSTDEWPLEPPYSEAGRAAQERWAANPDDDPSYRCIIPLGRIISAPLPFEIIEQPERITMLYEYDHQVRRVFLDGRGHPDSYPTLMGHSIGRWEGDTLVVETANIEPGLLRPQGMPYSDKLRLTERMTLLDDGQRLRVDLSIDDPTYYTETWTVTKYYGRTNEDIKDYECYIREHVAADEQHTEATR